MLRGNVTVVYPDTDTDRNSSLDDKEKKNKGLSRYECGCLLKGEVFSLLIQAPHHPIPFTRLLPQPQYAEPLPDIADM